MSEKRWWYGSVRSSAEKPRIRSLWYRQAVSKCADERRGGRGSEVNRHYYHVVEDISIVLTNLKLARPLRIICGSWEREELTPSRRQRSSFLSRSLFLLRSTTQGRGSTHDNTHRCLHPLSRYILAICDSDSFSGRYLGRWSK